MRGVKRVFAFCCLTAVLPAMLIICPLYLKHQVFKDIKYTVAESDILEVRDGISTIFCQEHVIKMNTSFNAFQLNQMPNQSKSRKHIRLKKSMELPDDTLEYWGFFLMKGASVELKVCSRFTGSRILVVKGERNLRTCGLMEHNVNKYGANYNPERSQVKVTFETAAEVVNSNEINMKEQNVKFSPNNAIDDEEMLNENHGGEDFEDDVRKKHKDFASNYLKVDKNTIPSSSAKTVDDKTENEEIRNEDVTTKHHKRHKLHDKHHEVPDNEDGKKPQNFRRRRSHKHSARDHPKDAHETRARRDTILDGGINHGGNAKTYLHQNESDSISSFENALFECYDGQILVAKGFEPSMSCKDVKSLDHGSHLVLSHEVNSDGYYYYIFYSDNDYASNQIHAVFDIYKPTYLYSNISETKGCINSTECRFPIQMFSDEVVIVEVPTRDGIEHEDDDISYLFSQCVPRMSVYVIFPIAVLVFILSCAFI